MTCGRSDVGYTCNGSGHPLGSARCVPEDHYDGCGQHFGSLSSFEWHFRPLPKGGQRCATDKELRRHGLQRTGDVWKSPMDPDTAARLHRHPSVTKDDLVAVLLGVS